MAASAVHSHERDLIFCGAITRRRSNLLQKAWSPCHSIISYFAGDALASTISFASVDGIGCSRIRASVINSILQSDSGARVTFEEVFATLISIARGTCTQEICCECFRSHVSSASVD
jgi:hypothetical protein